MDRRCVIDIALEAKSPEDGAKLVAALTQMAAADPVFQFRQDTQSGQIIVSGETEDHLDEVVDWLRGRIGATFNIGAPQVAYRETITRAVEHDYVHKHQLGGVGQFARIRFRIAPGNGAAFVASADVSQDYASAVRRGAESVLAAGPTIGFPIIDVTLSLLGVGWHDRDSSQEAFESAGRAGLREAIEKAGPIIIEPIMRLTAEVPEIRIGNVIGDINSRRGQIRETGELGGGIISIDAVVPMANLFGYRNAMRALTAGAGRYELSFDHYERTPDQIDPNGGFRPAMAMRA